MSPKRQYPEFASTKAFTEWVRQDGYRVVAFRDPKAGDIYVKWEASPRYPMTAFLKTQRPDHMWIPGDPLAIVEKL